MTDDEIQSLRFRRNYVLILTIAISVIFIAMIGPFIEALLIAAIGAAMLQPVYRWLRKLFGGRNAPASVVTILFLLLVIMGPLTAFIGVVVDQAVDEVLLESADLLLLRGQNAVPNGAAEYGIELHEVLAPVDSFSFVTHRKLAA